MSENVISSLDNSVVKEARNLNNKKFRRLLSKFLVDGEKLVREVVERNNKIDKIFVDEKRVSDFSYILEKFNGKVFLVTEKVLNSISENVTPQGIIAEVFMDSQNEIQKSENSPILILDRIQDPGNLGTMIRTAVATGFSRIVLIDSVDAFSPKVVRSSSGGIFNVEIFKMSEEDIINFCNENKIELLVADMNGENIFKMNYQNKNFALVIGNEGQGVSENFVEAGKVISLPMKEGMESLNAGISASVLMYALVGKDI